MVGIPNLNEVVREGLSTQSTFTCANVQDTQKYGVGLRHGSNSYCLYHLFDTLFCLGLNAVCFLAGLYIMPQRIG